MVQVEHTSLLDRHQYSNIALDFRHSRFSGTKGCPIFMPGHHVLKLGRMPSGSQYLTQDTQPSIQSVILNEGNCNCFQLFHTEIRTMRTASWHTTSYFDFTVLWDLLLSTVCGLPIFFLTCSMHTASNFSHNKVQESIKQREGSG